MKKHGKEAKARKENAQTVLKDIMNKFDDAD